MLTGISPGRCTVLIEDTESGSDVVDSDEIGTDWDDVVIMLHS